MQDCPRPLLSPTPLGSHHGKEIRCHDPVVIQLEDGSLRALQPPACFRELLRGELKSITQMEAYLIPTARITWGHQAFSILVKDEHSKLF